MKICKGIGKSKGASACGKESQDRQLGLCPLCLWNWMHETEIGKNWKTTVFDPRVKKKIEAKKKEQDKLMKINLTDWRPKLQKKIQEISRLIDIGLPCLALGYHAGQIQGGHIWAKGSHKNQSLNLHNIHRQSSQSNHSRNDDGLLREKLAEEYGLEYLEFVKNLQSTPKLEWINSDYHQFYIKACKIANNLKMNGQNFDLKERIKMRNNINIELGLYNKEQCVYEI